MTIVVFNQATGTSSEREETPVEKAAAEAAAAVTVAAFGAVQADAARTDALKARLERYLADPVKNAADAPTQVEVAEALLKLL